MSSKHTAWSAAAQVNFIKALRAKLEAQVTGETAEDCIKDTIEGCVDLDSIMNALLREKLDAEALEASFKAVAKEWRERAAAKEERAETIRSVILEALKASGQEGWKGTMGSVSLTNGGLSVEITDGSILPLVYVKPVPDVAAVRDDLLAIHKQREEILGQTHSTVSQKITDLTTLLFSDADACAAWLKSTGLAGTGTAEDDLNLLEALTTYDPVPGARLVRGDQSIAIRKPVAKSKKAA